VADFGRAVRALARAAGDTATGRLLVDSVESALESVRRASAASPITDHPSRPIIRRTSHPSSRPTVVWHIWDTPLFTVGRGSYMHELLEIAGARNAFGDLEAPSPQVTLEEVVRRNPDFIVAGPANAERIRASARWRALPAVRDGRVLVVDTLLVGRPGVRLGEAARHLYALFRAAGR
jgi:ABC-type hemin transport system substrate-binding protein